MRKRRPKQLEFEWRTGRGGPRRGSGRKPKGARAGVSRKARCDFKSRYPVHVTVRLRDGLPRLRNVEARGVLMDAFEKGCERFGFRLVEWSILDNHLHFIVEAEDRRSLSKGMQGLLVRIARGLNKHWGRTGSVFADRYHDHVLRTPREVRNALAYVLHNARKHGYHIETVDIFSSGAWFQGWLKKINILNVPAIKVVAEATTWLLRVGWRRHGLISALERPGGRKP